MDEKIIGEIQKTKNKKTIIKIKEFKGKTYIDQRDYFKSDKMDEWSPTKKGCMILTDQAAALVSIYEKVEDELNGSKTSSSGDG